MAPTPSNQVDSSWSWVMLACSFVCVFLFSLLGSSVGMAQVEMIEDLKFGSGAISVMTAFAVGWSTLLGPLSGAIASVLSMRFTIILGTILMSLGMLCTAFSHSLPALLFFYGIVTGLGHGIAYSPCIVIIHHYFRKRLLVANGIMTSSSSFAILSLPYLHRYILDEYGWRFCFAINAALLLHVIVFASMFKPTPMEKMSMINLSFSSCCSRQGDASKNGSEHDDENRDDLGDDYGWNNYNNHNDDHFINTTKQNGAQHHSNFEKYISKDPTKVGTPIEHFKSLEEKLFLSKESITSRKMNMLIKSTDNVSLGSKTLSLSGSSRPYIPVYINGTPKLRSPVSELIAAHSPSLRRSLHSEDGDVSRFIRDRSVSQLSSVSALTLDDPQLPVSNKLTTTISIVTTSPSAAFLKPHPHNHHRFGQLRKTSRSASHFGSSLVFASSDLGSSIMLPNLAIEEIHTTCGSSDDDVIEDATMSAKIKRIAGCQQLWLLCLNALFFMCGCGTHSIHLPSYVASKGVPSYLMANIYSVLGVVIALGRICGGLVYTKLKIPLVPLLFILQLLNGLFLMLSPFYANDTTGIFCMEIGIGLTYGQSYMLQAPIATHMVGVQDLAIAFGFIQLFNGIGYIGAPILAGYIYDSTGTFDIPMHIAGAVVTLGSFLVLPMWLMSHKEDRESDETATTPPTTTTTKDVGDDEKDYDKDNDDDDNGDNNDDEDGDDADTNKTKALIESNDDYNNV